MAPLDGKFSCQVCHKRKVKCDRKQPCSQCQKGGVDCIYLAPVPPRRRKRVADKDLLARLRRYEDQLKRAGIPVDDETPGSPSEGTAMDDVRHSMDTIQDSNGQDDSTTIKTQDGYTEINSAPSNRRDQYDQRFGSKATGGRFITDNTGHSRYLENNLWVTLNDELHDPEQMVQDQGKDPLPSDEEPGNEADPGYLLFGRPSSDRELRRQYPPPEVVDILWQTYIRNVNPILKVLHLPSFQCVVQMSKNDLSKISKGQLALLFSIFHFAVTSMDPESFEGMFTQPRDFLLNRFRSLTQQALLNVSFLQSSDIATLQAYVHYLLATRLIFDSQTIWALSGVAFRIAQRLGLHRDGATHGLPPFEVEMRRRLWLQLIILDHTSAELAGSTPAFWTVMSDYWDTKKPLNVNDADLDPTMTEWPVERVGATEMIFNLLRYEFGEHFRRNRRAMEAKDSFDGKWAAVGHCHSVPDKDKFIDMLQQKLEQSIVRYCDPIEPLHHLCMLAARSAIAGMRLRGHHPRQYSDLGASLPQEEKDLLFQLGLKVTQYDNLIHSTPSLKGFRWHINVYFQWHAFIYLLSELRIRRVGEDAQKGWAEVAGVFEHHHEILENHRYVLHAAVMSLTLKAWDSRESECRKQGLPLEIPEFINQIRGLPGSSRSSVIQLPGPGAARREGFTAEQIQISQDNQGTGVTWWTGIMDSNTSTTGSSSGGEPTPIDWSQWDSLLQVGDTYQEFFDLDSLYFRGQ